MGLYDLCVAVLMLVNSVAILNEERFLAKCALLYSSSPDARAKHE